MRRVLFDGISCQGEYKGHYHGGAEYGKFILFEALKRGYSFDLVMRRDFFTHSDMEVVLKRHPEINVVYVSNNQDLFSLIDNGNYDLFYSPLPYGYHNYPCKTKMLCVIHGLRQLELPWDKYASKCNTKPLLKLAGKLSPKFVANIQRKRKYSQFHNLLTNKNVEFVAASNHTKYSIVNFFPEVDVDNLKVFYSPFSIEGFAPVQGKKDYFLLLSANRYEKNGYRALRAIDQLFSEGHMPDKHVIVTGCQGVDCYKWVKNKERFKLLPYLTGQELIDAYRNAFCFVYPSLNEGFGYPPIMSMACGVPVAASCATSIPEACGDGAIFFDPTDANDLKNRILQVYYREDLRKMLVEKGHQRVQQLLEKQNADIEAYIKYIFEGE